ncbi:MAG: efflux RND transporter periplasmic adaptor subunit [Chitinophagaceae bacterium]|nr:efflux RND transporter periplasmic adaptor subunit [Chitinophagaceae bacterium]
MNRFRLGGGLLFLLLTACKEKTESILPARGTITEAVYSSGYIKSEKQYQIYPRASGVIKKLFVHRGDRVRKGQVIISVSSDVTRLNAESAGLNAAFSDYDANQDKIREARLMMDLAFKKMKSDSLTYSRQKRLWDEQIGTKYELEQRELAWVNARTSYQSAALRLRELERQLKYTSAQSRKTAAISKTMLSDFDIRSEQEGRLYALYKEEGEMVSPQAPVALVGNSADFLIVLQVDENDIIRVKEGQEVDITLESYKGQTFKATVRKIYPVMNERTRTFEVEASFTKSPPVLYPNLTVEANIILERRDDVLTIPRSFLDEENQVMISKKEKRKIRIGLKDYNRVEVLEGLTERERIYKQP